MIAWTFEDYLHEPKAHVIQTWTAQLGHFKLTVSHRDPPHDFVEDTTPPFQWGVDYRPTGPEAPVMTMGLGVSYAHAHNLTDAQAACIETAGLLEQVLNVRAKAAVK